MVVVGGGSAGAAVAARLSADPSRRVALLEAGPDYRAEDTPSPVRGGNFLRAIGLSHLRWPTVTARLTDVQEPKAYLCGRGVGGSSVINGQSAVRGLPGDFDRWAAGGCVGWSWTDVAPAFRDIEDDLDFGTEPYHGTGGPVPVSRTVQSLWGASSHAFAAAAAGLGHPHGADINAPGSTGVSPVAWNRRGDARVSTKDAYIEPARDRTNLEIVPDALALRARFRGSRFVGVDVATADGLTTVAADHGVVCAGAIHSPAFLLRSGVGPGDELRALDIPVVADRPGVGRNLQDHPTTWLMFPLAAQARLPHADALPGHCALRFSSRLPGGSTDDLQLYACDYAGPASSIGGMMVALLDPASTGRVSLRSPDPEVEPEVAFGMLADRADVDRLAAGLREAVRVLAQEAFASVLDGPARLPTGLRTEDVPDGDLPELLRATCFSYNHATGTCRMGAPTEPDSVVDERGRVLGVEGLSVADASVMPRIVRAPTHLTTVMLAERIASQHAAQQL